MGEYSTLTNDSQLHNARFDETWKAFSPSNTSSVTVLSIEEETDKSWKIKVKTIKGKEVALWFPKSNCQLNGDVLYVPMWLLQKKNKEL